MIIELRGSERAAYPEYFERMFKLRHEVFIRQRGWPLPAVRDKEIDQYDRDDTVYLLDFRADESIQGMVRLTPTESGSLLADYFPHLVESSVSARSPLIVEATRYIFLPLSKRREENRIARGYLLSKMMEWCLRHHFTHLQCVVDISAFPGFVEMVPQTIPLGLPQPCGGGRSAPGGSECIAFRWPVTIEVIEAIKHFTTLNQENIPDQERAFGGAEVLH
jgi:acyl-homoserine lactone synthase